MTGKSKFYRWLGRIFWLSIVAVTGYTWYYMDQAVPDRVSIIQNQEEDFSLGLPLKATIISDSEEVSLGNESNIPADQITISGRQHFSMIAGEQGSYQVGLKLFGLIKLKDIQVDVVDTRYAIPCGSPIGIYLRRRHGNRNRADHGTGRDGSGAGLWHFKNRGLYRSIQRQAHEDKRRPYQCGK